MSKKMTRSFHRKGLQWIFVIDGFLDRVNGMHMPVKTVADLIGGHGTRYDEPLIIMSVKLGLRRNVQVHNASLKRTKYI